MNEKKIRVLVVDDSALFRALVTETLATDPALEVVGSAPDPVAAWAAIKTLRPDVITLDIEMPRMDGLTFLELLMTNYPVPVVLVSSLAGRNAETTIRALELGAVEVVQKPVADLRESYGALARDLIGKVKVAATARPRKGTVRVPREAVTSGQLAPKFRTTNLVIAVGASTGGTEALATFISELPPETPGLVIVQHMPARFTGSFAQRLDHVGAVRVREAKEGDRVLVGHALLAPGGRHVRLRRDGAQYVVTIDDGDLVGGHRPSVDVLFHSCAKTAGRNAVGVIMTGMGADGADGMKAMHDAGARTFAQDEKTCVVFGMPREAIARGGVDSVLPLEKIAGAVIAAAGGDSRASQV